MSEHRLNAAKLVAEQIVPAETAVDRALAEIGTLVSTMVDARRMGNLPVMVGQEALEHVGEGMSQAIRMRASMVAAHNSFAKTKTRIGLREKSLGDEYDTPAIGELSSDIVPFTKAA